MASATFSGVRPPASMKAGGACLRGASSRRQGHCRPAGTAQRFGRLGIEQRMRLATRYRPAPAPHVGFVLHLDGLDDRLARERRDLGDALRRFRAMGLDQVRDRPLRAISASSGIIGIDHERHDPGPAARARRQVARRLSSDTLRGLLGKNTRPTKSAPGVDRRVHRLGRREAADLDLNGHGGPPECPAPPWPGRRHP